MAIQPRAYLKTLFETDDFPPEEAFWDLIDSMVSKADDGTPISFVPTPPATTDDPGAAGQMAYDDDYLYLCTSTNKWKRMPLAEW